MTSILTGTDTYTPIKKDTYVTRRFMFPRSFVGPFKVVFPQDELDIEYLRFQVVDAQIVVDYIARVKPIQIATHIINPTTESLGPRRDYVLMRPGESVSVDMREYVHIQSVIGYSTTDPYDTIHIFERITD
jgi:hypothetical protein